MRHRLLAIALLASCGAVLRPPAPDRRFTVKVNGTLFDSDRGYRFAALPEPGASVVRLDVRYPVGSADDPPGKAGLAHLVEHLVYEIEITRDGEKTSIGAELGRLALGFNAATYADSTVYEVVAAPGALPAILALEVEKLQVGCVGLSRETFERERGVVLAELRERQGASGAAFQRVLNEAVYPEGSPYRQVASVATVGALTYEDACGFLVSTYRRGPAIVIASGAVSGPALQAAAAQHLGRAPRRTGAPRQSAGVLPVRHATVRVRAAVVDPVLIVVWPLPPRASRDYRLLQLATRYIDSFLGGEALAYKLGTNASTSMMGGEHTPALAVTLELASLDRADAARAAVGRAVDQAVRTLSYHIDNRESPLWIMQWEPAVEQLVARWESLAGRNGLLAEMLALGGPTDSLTARVDELAASTPAETRKLAEAWLDGDRSRTLIIEPTGEPGEVTQETATGAITGHAHGTRVDGALADVPAAFALGALPRQAETYETANGLRVVLWPHGTAPITHGFLIVDSGTAHEPAGLEGISAFAGGAAGEDSLVFYERKLSNRVDDLVQALTVELRDPGYAVSEDGLAQRKKRLARDTVAAAVQFETQRLGALYGPTHPYARTGMTVASAGRITHDEAQDWARDHVVPANATLVITGKFDPALVKQHIAYTSDQVSRGKDSAPVAAVPRGPTSPQFIRGVAPRATPTVLLSASFVAGAGIDRDYASRLVLRAALESLFADLRTDAALTYGTSVSYEPRQAGGLWTVSARVDARRAAEGAMAMLSRLAEVRADPEVLRESLVLGRKSVLQSLLVESGDASEVASQLAVLARFDLDAVQLATLAQRVAQVTLAPLHAFAQQDLAATKLVFAAYGNADAVDAALAAVR